VIWLDSYGPKEKLMAGSYEHGKEPSDSIKCGKCLTHLVKSGYL
jgi:hypothetical protein